MLTPPFRLVGEFFAHLPQRGSLFTCPGGAIFICPVGLLSQWGFRVIQIVFLFLTNFLLWVPLLGLVITPSPDRLLMGLVITSPPDRILGRRPAVSI